MKKIYIYFLFLSFLLISKELQGHQDAEKLFKEGYKAYFMLELLKAEKYFKDAISIDKKNHNYYLYLGKTLYKLDRLEEALINLETAVSLDPYLVEAYSFVGEIKMKQKKLEEAERAYLKVLSITPDDFNALFKLGSICLEQNKPAASIEYLTKAAKIDPTDSRVPFLLGRVYLAADEYILAIAEFTKAIKLEPTNPIYYYWRGNAYFAQADYTSPEDREWCSVEDYKEAIAYGLETPYVHFMYGNTLLHRAFYYLSTDRKELAENLLEAAIVRYKHVIRLSPTASNAYNNLGLAYYFLNRLDEAIAAYKEAIKNEPTVAIFHDNLADAYFKKAEFKKAIEEWELVLELDPLYTPPKLPGLIHHKPQPISEKIRAAKRCLLVFE